MILRTAIVGFGKIAAGYAADPVAARAYRYATHVQVLMDHPAFHCAAAIDPSGQARAAAKEWGIPVCVADASEIAADEIDVVVIATGPQDRQAIVEKFPTAKAVIVEKPIGTTAAEAARFLDYCERRGILVQVNLWRRADSTFRALAEGDLARRIGRPQIASVVYGNGIANNAIHMVDLVAMLVGPIAGVQAIGAPVSRELNAVAGDVDLAFVANLVSGQPVSFLPVNFSFYRENSIDIWGSDGRFEALTEGLLIRTTPRRPSRSVDKADEIAADKPELLDCTVGDALWHLYDNLASTLLGRVTLCSPGINAVVAQRAVETALRSAAEGCRPILLKAEV